ncbi:MAG: hypothetical protein COA79_11655 [Planctomycetota bacterium]|nr:MAG: hypothetical protein COA79_11655 [Planctomycetota bacterium]
MQHCPFCHENLTEPIPKKCKICGNSIIDLGAHTILNIQSGDESTYNTETITLPKPITDISSNQLDTIWSKTITSNDDLSETIKSKDNQSNLLISSNVKLRELQHSDQSNISLPDYELKKVIGEGGMGIVYIARQTSIDREIAIKMIKDKYSNSDQIKNKFLSEAIVTGDLDHPNIVPIHDLGSDSSGNLFFSMKHVQGKEWKDVIETKSLQENLDILMRVSDAIAFAHNRNVIHRDLKPENIMLGNFGEVLVMDWGLAVSTIPNGKAENVSDAGLGGTPPYMAPEMASGDLKSSFLSDIYLLGAILYEIISGKKPHGGKSVKECLVNAAKNIIQPINEKGELVRIALKSMATNPEDRYSSVQDFQNAIRKYLSHAESVVLTEQADLTLTIAAKTKSYSDYARAMYTFEQALELWRENGAALNGVSVARLSYANCAYKKGDLSQAESLLTEAKLLKTPIGAMVLSSKKEQSSRIKRVKMLTIMAKVLTVAVICILSGAFLWIQDKEQRAIKSEMEAIEAKKTTFIALKEVRKKEIIAIESANEAKKQFHNAQIAQKNTTIALEEVKKEKENSEVERKRAEAVSRFLTDMLAKADPNGKNGYKVTVLMVMDQMSKVIKSKFKNDNNTLWRIEKTIGRVYHGIGRYNEAKPHLQNAISLSQILYGKESLNYAYDLTSLANLYMKQFYYSLAEPLYLKAILIKKNITGTDSLNYANSLNNLVKLYGRQNRFPEAEVACLEAMSIQRKLLGNTHSSYASSLNNLSTLYAMQTKHKKAEPLFLESIEIKKKVYGTKHPLYALSLINLATLYTMQKKYKKAEILYIEAIEIEKKTIGINHPTFANTLGSLAELYRSIKQFKKAEPLYLQAIKIQKKVFGVSNPNCAINLNNLSNMYSMKGQYVKSLLFAKEAAKITKYKHPDLLDTLAHALFENGKFKEAVEVQEKAISLLPKYISLKEVKKMKDRLNKYKKSLK